MTWYRDRHVDAARDSFTKFVNRCAVEYDGRMEFVNDCYEHTSRFAFGTLTLRLPHESKDIGVAVAQLEYRVALPIIDATIEPLFGPLALLENEGLRSALDVTRGLSLSVTGFYDDLVVADGIGALERVVQVLASRSKSS